VGYIPVSTKTAVILIPQSGRRTPVFGLPLSS
jgi:hypothetical protein